MKPGLILLLLLPLKVSARGEFTRGGNEISHSNCEVELDFLVKKNHRATLHRDFVDLFLVKKVTEKDSKFMELTFKDERVILINKDSYTQMQLDKCLKK